LGEETEHHLEDFQASPARPSGKGYYEMKMDEAEDIKKEGVSKR
jgi:hypothetical protein